MIYLINFAAIYDLVDEEISRVAANEFADDGTPLFDSIVLHSRDRSTIKRLHDDAINTIVKRNYDVITILPSNRDGLPGLQFNVPDLDTSTEGMIGEELTRFVTLNVCAAWFQSRAKVKVEEYANRGQVALDKASAMLHTRKTPTR